MRQVPIPVAALAAGLVACSQPAQDGAATDPAAASPAPPAATTATPTASPATATAIPARFRGVWDNMAGSCNPASDLRMEIGAVSIEFYESLGTVTGVTVDGPDSIVVDMAMEGEGERWTQRRAYRLSADDRQLTTSLLGEAPDIASQLKRCPA